MRYYHICLLVVVFGVTLFSCYGSTFYVSLNGNDSWSGTLPTPNSANTDGPFATLTTARNAVRTLKISGYTNNIEIFIRGGTYLIENAIEFTAFDSGREGQIIKYAAYPGEAVTISGARLINGWSQMQTVGEKVWWHTTISEVAQKNWFFRDLYLDDTRLIRARWPNTGFVDVASTNWNTTEVQLSSTCPSENLAGQNAEFVCYFPWGINREVIASSSDSTLHFNTPASAYTNSPDHWAFGEVKPGNNAYLEHAQAFLDQNHEWFLNAQTGELILILRSGINPKTADIWAPVAEQLVTIKGSGIDSKVQHLRFENLYFAYNNYLLDSEGYSAIQSTHYSDELNFNDWTTRVLPGAIEVVYAENIEFIRTKLAHTAASGITFGAGCSDNTIKGCEISDVGATAISVGWEGTEPRKFASDWLSGSDIPVANTLSANYIHHFGRVYKDAAGLWVGYTDSTVIQNNEITDGPYSGLSLGWNWGTDQTNSRNALVEKNHIHHILTELVDGGCIYVLGYQPGSTMRGNVIHDIHRAFLANTEYWKIKGYYFDQGSKGWHVANNVSYNIPNDSNHSPIHFNTVNTNAALQTWETNYFDRSITGCRGIDGIGPIEIFSADNPSSTVSSLINASGPAPVAKAPSVGLSCSELAGGIVVKGMCQPWAVISTSTVMQSKQDISSFLTIADNGSISGTIPFSKTGLDNVTISMVLADPQGHLILAGISNVLVREPCDLNCDKKVNMSDYYFLASEWLNGSQRTTP